MQNINKAGKQILRQKIVYGVDMWGDRQYFKEVGHFDIEYRNVKG